MSTCVACAVVRVIVAAGVAEMDAGSVGAISCAELASRSRRRYAAHAFARCRRPPGFDMYSACACRHCSRRARARHVPPQYRCPQ